MMKKSKLVFIVRTFFILVACPASSVLFDVTELPKVCSFLDRYLCIAFLFFAFVCLVSLFLALVARDGLFLAFTLIFCCRSICCCEPNSIIRLKVSVVALMPIILPSSKHSAHVGYRLWERIHFLKNFVLFFFDEAAVSLFVGYRKIIVWCSSSTFASAFLVVLLLVLLFLQ